MQEVNGSLGIPMTPGGERATRIASLLQWGQMRLGKTDPGAAVLAKDGVDKWITYILDGKGAWETGVMVYAMPAPHVF